MGGRFFCLLHPVSYLHNSVILYLMNIRNTVVTLALSSLLVVGLSGYKTGVDNNRTGAQLGDQGCGFCHATNDAHIAVAFELDSAGSSVYDWYPGVTYTVKLIAANTSPTYLPKFGFQLSTVAGVSATPAQAGTFTASGIPAGTGLRTVSGVTYLQQNTKLSPASGYGDYGTVLNRFLMQSAIGYPLSVHGTGRQPRPP
ncbi:MAG: hypothetical protein EBZ77_18080, partial [Chitinophagia bacterium]|nr:hypothetical protein [Chitinophagia bacterium]